MKRHWFVAFSGWSFNEVNNKTMYIKGNAVFTFGPESFLPKTVLDRLKATCDQTVAQANMEVFIDSVMEIGEEGARDFGSNVNLGDYCVRSTSYSVCDKVETR